MRKISLFNISFNPIFALIIIMITSLSLTTSFSAENNKGLMSIYIKVSNNLDMVRKDVLISIPIDQIKEKYSHFDVNAFTVFDGKDPIPAQTEDLTGDKNPDNILLLINFRPNETKTLVIENEKMAGHKKEIKKRTQAILAVKSDYEFKDGYYTGGKFINVPEVEVPKDHFPHNALLKFEGPGWESDKVAYRFYLDSRNKNDIFAKKVDVVVLHRVGNTDLVSDSKESYTKMCDWGMDIFKVGESLGIGSIGMWSDNKVFTVDKTDKVVCQIASDGNIKSAVLTNYKGWSVGGQKFDLTSLLSISAGSRLTKAEIKITPNSENICTGLAKHADCSLIADSNNYEWSYIASYGKQSLAGDNLGIAIFFKRSDLVSITENNASYIVVLKPQKEKVTYYFAAAPEMELDGIKSEGEFLKYLHDIIIELSNPVAVELK